MILFAAGLFPVVAPPEPRNRRGFLKQRGSMSRRYPYHELGRELIDGSWAVEPEFDSVGSALGDLTHDTGSNHDLARSMVLLAAILKEQIDANKAILKRLSAIERAIKDAPKMAEIAVEKERQKTADKQLKANEAMPDNVVVVQCSDEVLDDLQSLGSVRRHF